jgi:bile salt-stimulated lipase
LQLKNKETLPVMVYIHGGAFMFGGSEAYGAKYIMDRDVVFVTINYRLGPLGKELLACITQF